MIRAIAIDDEPLALGVLKELCARSKGIELMKAFTSPAEALVYISRFPVDLVFLDIQMPEILGTDLAKKIPKTISIVFTTAYEEFALEGFNLNAVDYLLKPISPLRFDQTLEKVIRLGVNSGSAGEAGKQFVTVRADYSLQRIELSKIIYVEGLDDYIKIYIENSKTVITRITLKSFLDLLPQADFMRVHRSFIVPLNKIKGVKNKQVLIQEVKIPIGSSYEKTILEQLRTGRS